MFFTRRKSSDLTHQSVAAPTQQRTGHRQGAVDGISNGTRTGISNSTSNSKGALAQEEQLALRTRQGHPIMAFPAATIRALRYMATRLLVNEKLPIRLGLLAALRTEGVTYNALALSTLLAHDTPKRVCYVDLNWWHPAEQLQQSRAYNRGIAEILQQQVKLESALIATNYANLSLLSAGVMAPQRRAMMARSAELAALIDELSGEFDQLVIDIPAILTTSDAIPLASLADAGCLVIHHGVSTSELANRALADVDHLPMLGAILNRSDTHIPDWLLKWIPQE